MQSYFTIGALVLTAALAASCGSPMPPMQGPPPGTPAADLERAVRELNQIPPEPSHEHAIRALRALAIAMEQLGVPDDQLRRDSVATIRSAAFHLEHSPRASLEHAEFTKAGLEAALNELGTVHPARGQYDAVLARARAAVSVIQPKRPMLQQGEAVRHAFEAVADAVDEAARLR